MKKKKNNITLLDIAEKLKVTKVTVSKALRNHPDISDNTKEMVKKAAEEMGYIPNIAARNLSARKTNTIGVIIPKVAHSFYPSLVDALYKYASINNYEIILTVSQEDTELEKQHLTTMLAMKVDGVIAAVTNNTSNSEVFDIIVKSKIPLIQIDRTISDSFTKIVFDDVEGTQKAVDYAIKSGCRKPAFIGGNHELHVGRDRLAGFLKAIVQHNIAKEDSLILEGGFNEQTGYQAVHKFHQDGNMPDFIFAVTYPIALGVYSAANELKLTIPKDLQVISFGDSFFNSYLDPPVKAIRQDTGRMAEAAINEIVYAINNKSSYIPKKIVLDSEPKYV